MDNARLTRLVALANDYCVTVENAPELELREFVLAVTDYLPRLYSEFCSLEPETEADEFPYFSAAMDEDYYDSIRRRLEALLGEEDVFLETQLEDMKYSDTPIGASISESLADIFQDLYNFVSAVRESDGEMTAEAFAVCHDAFISYWSQTLCNVMRPLNRLRFS